MQHSVARIAKQGGVALITALLVIALVTSAAVAMASRQQLDIRRTANTLQRDQAYVYAMGAEIMARAVLAKDDPQKDHKKENWGQSGVSIPFEGGLLTGTLEDIQGRFNLNNVVKNNAVNPPDVERLKRLLAILKGNSPSDGEVWKNAEPGDLANAVLDWIDADDNVSPSGAEDGDYLQTERPYRAANAPMAATSELLLVRGFTAAIYREVAPYVTALAEYTKINVNTAKLEVLRTLDGDASCIVIAKLGRQNEALAMDSTAASAQIEPIVFKTPDEFLLAAGCTYAGFINNRTPAPGTSPPAPAAGLENPAEVLSVNSSYFQVNAYAEVGPEDHRVKVKLYSVLQRKAGKIATLSRAQGFE